MNGDLSRIPIEELLNVVLVRSGELFQEDGMLIFPAYRLRVKLASVVCADGIPYRHNESGDLELMAIRRKTGPFTGKLCFVGGVIAKGEHIEAAMRRHIETDLGVGIASMKFLFHSEQGSKLHEEDPEGWWYEPTKDHNIGITFGIQLASEEFSFGATAYGGQEADRVEWFTKETMPPLKEFGYNHDRGYCQAFILLGT